MSVVRDNLMNQSNYTPYCGGTCERMPRTRFDGEQFVCPCGWRSGFPTDFIEKYKQRWAAPPLPSPGAEQGGT